MCGIVGYVGNRAASQVLLEGLRRLEYRGYDSAGIAVVCDGRLSVTKTAGRVQRLRDKLPTELDASTGIAHTRWATHGQPNEANAHPHTDTEQRVAVVHNGIVENADELRRRVQESGTPLRSDTDTEPLAHLIAAELRAGSDLPDAVRTVLRQVEGTYGIVVLDRDRPGELVAARNGSPIVLGIGQQEMFVASDVSALVQYTQQVVYLDDGELALIDAAGYHTSSVSAANAQPADDGADRRAAVITTRDEDYQLGDFTDFMRKEIFEQPEAVRRALRGRLDDRYATAHFGGLELDARELRAIRSVKFLGCGSAYYAGQLGAMLIEDFARIPADAEPASEFRYRNPVVDPRCLYVAVSQSGETVDTLMGVQELKRKGGRVLGAVNVVGSAIARECDAGIFLHAGPEVSVASTKAFTNMVVSFAMLGLHLGRMRDLSPAEGSRIVGALSTLPERISELLDTEGEIAAVAGQFASAQHMFFIGRVRNWPTAREGAQKLKEISYLHAEAYQAGELKHGPLALIDGRLPSVVLLPDDELHAKNLSTIEQIKSRGGPVIVVTNLPPSAADDLADAVIRVPRTTPELDPILLTIALQLFAYHVAVKLGRDIDKPRNLAKSVTVE